MESHPIYTNIYGKLVFLILKYKIQTECIGNCVSNYITYSQHCIIHALCLTVLFATHSL